MRKGLLLLWMTFYCIDSIASVPIVTISKAQFGIEWAFTREEVQLRCAKNHGLFVINTATLAQYPLNDIAAQQIREGKVLGEPLEKIWRDDPQHQGKKMSLAPFIKRAQALCR